jgi:hypothetical protein
MDSITKHLTPTTIVLTATAVAVSAFALSSLTRSTSRNPFSADVRTPKVPFEHDKEKRDAVIRQGWTAKKMEKHLASLPADQQTFDAIIIGSGVGGKFSPQPP